MATAAFCLSISSRVSAACSRAVLTSCTLRRTRPGSPAAHADHAAVHVRVVAAAELGALAVEDHWSWPSGIAPRGSGTSLVRVAGDGVHLAAELGDPPRVDDVVGRDVQHDGHADRHDHVHVGEDLLLGRGTVAPHVLLAVDADLEAGAARPAGRLVRRGVERVGRRHRVAVRVDVRRRRVLDAGQLDEREDRDEDEDHEGADGPADLELRVAVDLGRDQALAGAELEQRPQQRPLDAHEDDQARMKTMR